MPGGDCKDFSKYHDKVDVNGDIVASWAEMVKAGSFRCKVCSSNVLTFNRGMVSFNQHASTKVHKDNIKKQEKHKKQLSIAETFKAVEIENGTEQELKLKVQNFEIDLVRRGIAHNIPPRFFDCLTETLHKHLNNNDAKDIVAKMKLNKTKVSYVAQYGISKTYFEETVHKLQICDGFSIGFDESEMNKVHELEILVVIANKETGIELRHYRTVALDGTDAETIADTITDQLEEDKIDWKSKLVSVMTDGCPTMQGNKTGVKKRIMDKAPQVLDFGSCNGHHLGNAARHGCNSIKVTEHYENLYEVFIDVVCDIGGAPGKGLKKKEEFEQLAKSKGRTLKPFKTYGGTRFKGYTSCITPILFNWETLNDYYSSLKTPSKRQEKLVHFFVEREFESLLKLNFIVAATKDIMDAIDYFEERENKIHLSRRKMESTLRTLLLKFVKKSSVDNVVDNEVSSRTGAELLQVKFDEDRNLLSRNSVFIGQKCSKLIRDLDLVPTSTQLDEFYTTVFTFYKTEAEKLIGYFNIGLRSIELEYMEAFSPHNRKNESTVDQILYLAGSFSKILQNIRPHDGYDTLTKEIQMYQVDEDVQKIDKTLSFDKFWSEVGQITEGSEKWKVFVVLPRFAKALGTPFNSGSEMERGFSKQSDILRDPKRNGMKHETLDTNLQIRFGIECKETVEKCPKCLGKPSQNCMCHCSLAEISDTMRANCSQASKMFTAAKNRSDDNDNEGNNNEDIEILTPNDDQSLKKRVDKFKESLSKRSTFNKVKPTPRNTDPIGRVEALNERKRRQETDSNSNKVVASKRKKIPIRKPRDIDSEAIVDKD